jgi:hypothetical protein
MNVNSSYSPDPGTTAPVQESTPRHIGYGHPEYAFVQAIMELQKSLGEIKAEIHALQVMTDNTQSKVVTLGQKVDDLVKWKHLILGGAVTLGFLMGLVIAVVKWL